MSYTDVQVISCPAGIRSSLATNLLTKKQSVTATALEIKLITLNRLDIYKPWSKSLDCIEAKLKHEVRSHVRPHSLWMSICSLDLVTVVVFEGTVELLTGEAVEACIFTYAQTRGGKNINPISWNRKEMEPHRQENNKLIMWDWKVKPAVFSCSTADWGRCQVLIQAGRGIGLKLS